MSDNPDCYRKDLPPIPKRILKLPIQRQYPVPFFVAEIDGDYDFRVIGAGKIAEALEKNLCWICGERLGTMLAFVIGPMCSINRVISEPPSHRACAEFALKACPFLIQQMTRRNETNLPEGTSEAAGIGIKRQPGVALLWLTKSYRVIGDGRGGILFNIGEPELVEWYREGRFATRTEAIESIESGLPILQEMALKEGVHAVADLENKILIAKKYLPSHEPKKRVTLGVAARVNRKFF